MTTKTVTVPAIGCAHCVMTIENEASKQVIIEWNDPASWDQIRSLLIEIDYPAEEA